MIYYNDPLISVLISMHIIVLLLYETLKLLLECWKSRSQYYKYEYGGYMVKLDLVYK